MPNQLAYVTLLQTKRPDFSLTMAVWSVLVQVPCLLNIEHNEHTLKVNLFLWNPRLGRFLFGRLTNRYGIWVWNSAYSDSANQDGVTRRDRETWPGMVPQVLWGAPVIASVIAAGAKCHSVTHLTKPKVHLGTNKTLQSRLFNSLGNLLVRLREWIYIEIAKAQFWNPGP